MDAKRAVAVAIASSLGALAGDIYAADAATLTVYKCKQANGGVLYQDYPCKDGVVVDIKPDAADPAAIARLERAQALYERDAARRRADEASEERRRAAFERMRSEAASTQDYAAQAEDLYLPAYPFYVPQARPRAKAHASRAGDDQRRNSHEHRVPVIVRRPRAG